MTLDSFQPYEVPSGDAILLRRLVIKAILEYGKVPYRKPVRFDSTPKILVPKRLAILMPTRMSIAKQIYHHSRPRGKFRWSIVGK